MYTIFGVPDRRRVLIEGVSHATRLLLLLLQSAVEPLLPGLEHRLPPNLRLNGFDFGIYSFNRTASKRLFLGSRGNYSTE